VAGRSAQGRKRAMSLNGTFETCRRMVMLSVHRGRAEVVGKQANRRERSLAQGESEQVSNEPRNKARDHRQHQSPVSRVRNLFFYLAPKIAHL
jgi:hypothetical protein